MDFRLPSSPNKRYLTGPDWVITSLDYAMKRTTCAGNSSQVVMRLGGLLAEAGLRGLLDRVCAALPVLAGRVSRDLNLTPYWHIPTGPGPGARLYVYDAQEPMEILAQAANRPFDSELSHVVFHYVRCVDDSYLAITFDHRLLDARGAEALLWLMQECSAGGLNVDGIRLRQDALLDKWGLKFLAGRNVNRKFIALSKPMPDCLPLPGGDTRGFKYLVSGFSAHQTAQLMERAAREAGYLFELPFLLASVYEAVDELFKSRGIGAANYLVPVTVDMRKDGEERAEMFFNHVSYLLFKAGPQELASHAALVGALKAQMYEHVKSGMLRDLASASHLVRIAPRWFLNAALSLPFKGTLASFCFSYIGRSAYRGHTFMGLDVKDMFHMPRVPAPPGLGVFCTMHGGRMHLTVSWLDGLLSDAEAKGLEAAIHASLTQ